MKIRLLDDLPFDEVRFGNEKFFENGLEVIMKIEDSKSFIIIKNNVIQYLEKHKFAYQHLQNDDNPLRIYPFASFTIIRLTKDFYKTHMYSKYKIKFDIAGLDGKWYFIDLNWWQKFRLDFSANYTILNSSNIHQLIYGVFGGIVGALLLKLITGSLN